MQEQHIQHAIKLGIQDYFQRCHDCIPAFVRRHYHYPGCWQTNRQALGFDLLRAPINLLWGPTYILLILCLFIAGYCGLHRARTWAHRLPGGVRTKVQCYVNERISDELLNAEALKHSINARLQALPELKALSDEKHHQLIEYLESIVLENIVEEALQQLTHTRTASADISNTLATTAFGALLFKKFTPGGFGIGLLLAAIWVEERAVNNFFFGETLGGFYYSIFPPVASFYEQAISVVLVILVLAVFASFSGLITDPIQGFLKLHQRRLRKMIGHIEKDLYNQTGSSFKPLDPYIARILELVDTLKVPIGF